jgi:hypothetical protein
MELTLARVMKREIPKAVGDALNDRMFELTRLDEHGAEASEDDVLEVGPVVAVPAGELRIEDPRGTLDDRRFGYANGPFCDLEVEPVIDDTVGRAKLQLARRSKHDCDELCESNIGVEHSTALVDEL